MLRWVQCPVFENPSILSDSGFLAIPHNDPPPPTCSPSRDQKPVVFFLVSQLAFSQMNAFSLGYTSTHEVSPVCALPRQNFQEILAILTRLPLGTGQPSLHLRETKNPTDQGLLCLVPMRIYCWTVPGISRLDRSRSRLCRRGPSSRTRGEMLHGEDRPDSNKNHTTANSLNPLHLHRPRGLEQNLARPRSVVEPLGLVPGRLSLFL